MRHKTEQLLLAVELQEEARAFRDQISQAERRLFRQLRDELRELKATRRALEQSIVRNILSFFEGGLHDPPQASDGGWPGRRAAVARLIERDGAYCARCGCDWYDDRDGRMQVDHVIPVSLGGPHDDWNLQLLCGLCNNKKGTRLEPISLLKAYGRWQEAIAKGKTRPR
jgi:hypothetical protein